MFLEQLEKLHEKKNIKEQTVRNKHLRFQWFKIGINFTGWKNDLGILNIYYSLNDQHNTSRSRHLT